MENEGVVSEVGELVWLGVVSRVYVGELKVLADGGVSDVVVVDAVVVIDLDAVIVVVK